MAAARSRDERWLIAGLGNHGDRYRDTRHNVGFMVADRLAGRDESLRWRPSSRFRGELVSGSLGQHAVVLLKPHTYMNLSGESVAAVARFYRIPTARLIVVHDDVDLDLGRIKVKRDGGDGGHKGIRSITQHLDADFVRIRLGVGRPERGDVVDYVLAPFSAEEREQLGSQLDRAVSAVRTVLSRGYREAMNRFNRRTPPAVGPRERAGGEVERGRDEIDGSTGRGRAGTEGLETDPQ